MGKKSPKPADPVATAGAQTSQNIGTAIAQQYLNNVNQVTPDGALTYNQTGTFKYTDPLNDKTYKIPRFTATQTLSPEQQRIQALNSQTETNLAEMGRDQSARIDKLLGSTMSFDGLPSMTTGADIRNVDLSRVGSGPALETQIGDAGPITRTYGTDFSSDRQRVEDALMERMNPSIERDRERLESRLANQGIRIGSEAYRSAMDDMGRNVNDARLSAIIGAGQEQSRLAGLEAARATFENQAQQQQFGQNAAQAGLSNDALQQMRANEVQGANFDNQAGIQEANADIARGNLQNSTRAAAMNERFAERSQPINEITALLSGSAIQNPNFINPNSAQIPTTDFAGIQANYDNAMAQRNASSRGFFGDILGGLMGAGASIYTASDRGVKEDVKRVGKTDDGQPIYRFRYKSGGPMQMGLMAQDVEKTNPKAVKTIGGVKMVDYGRALS